MQSGRPFGGDRGIQTLGLCNANAALYQLSYIPAAIYLATIAEIWRRLQPLEGALADNDLIARLAALAAEGAGDAGFAHDVT